MKYKAYGLNNHEYDLDNDGQLISDIAYKTDSEKNKLDLYLPTQKKGKYPLVIFIHGGGLIKSDKSHHMSSILNVLQDGFAVASINYRLNNEVTYPEILKDCIDALIFLGINSKQFNLDKNKFMLWGETHGAYLADAIGIEYHTNPNYQIVGVISFYAPIDLYQFHKFQIDSGQLMKIDEEVADERSFGASGNHLLERLKSMDLLARIDGTQPPFYLLHGKKDDFIPLDFSYRFADCLASNGIPFIFNTPLNGTHGIDYYAKAEFNVPIRKFINNCFLR